MKIFLTLLLLAAVFFLFLVIYALMRTAKNADEQSEQYAIRRMRELRNEYDRKDN